MIDFCDIKLEDRESIERYTLSNTIYNNDLSFANMYCWQPIMKSQWAIVDGFLVIKYAIDGGDKIGYMQPIGLNGDSSFSRIVPVLIDDAQERGGRLRLIGLSEQGRFALCGDLCEHFSLYSSRDEEDYIYLREDLQQLPGKRFQPKRNHINRFKSKYNYSVEPLSQGSMSEALVLYDSWMQGRDIDVESLDERAVMIRAFQSWDALGLHGIALRVDGVMVAFSYGSQINEELFCTHIEKGDTAYEGVYATINQAMAASLPESYIYINREDDMGIEGLRKAKLSYHPIKLQPKFRAIYLTGEESDCFDLWYEVFRDSREDIDDFIVNHYRDSGAIYIKEQERVVAMLHLLEFDSQLGRCGYIYAVATQGLYRGKGYATSLINKAIERAKELGYSCVVTIPASESLRGWYGEFGFKDSIPTTFSSPTPYDFGSGDREQDLAMILPLSDISSQPTTLHLSKGYFAD
ncbi:MAG: GNAT family N-acetyltransferase [Rikenellaceae bacterium]